MGGTKLQEMQNKKAVKLALERGWIQGKKQRNVVKIAKISVQRGRRVQNVRWGLKVGANAIGNVRFVRMRGEERQ